MIALQNLYLLASARDLALLSRKAAKAKKPRIGEHGIPCAMGAVTAAVAFLECSINGLYAHAASKLGRQTNLRRLLSSIYHDKLKFAYLPWLTKYQVALAMAHKPVFELGAEPYQSAELLNQLRNELLHPKEIMAGLGRGTDLLSMTSLEKRLRGKFRFNDLALNEFIPYRCLSPSCALWAVRTAATFYLEFESRLPAKAYISRFASDCESIVSGLPLSV